MRIVIVEDEAMVARSLVRCVKAVLGDSLRQLDVFDNLDAAESALRNAAPDVLLLDLNIHGEDGFGLLRQAVAGSFETIVVSANTNRALEAFEHGVIDFLPKPCTEQGLSRAFGRVAGRAARSAPIRYLIVRHAGRLERIDVEQVMAIHGSGDYSELELFDGTRRLHEKSLERLVQVLSLQFLRIHRSHIVNRKAMRALMAHAGSRYTLSLGNGAELPVGRKWVNALRAALGKNAS